MYDNELKLISRSPAGRDRRGQVIYSETSRATLCEVVPISRDEYFRGAENGINAEFEFKINPIEYNHEKIVEFDLNDEEKALFKKSADAVRNTNAALA